MTHSFYCTVSKIPYDSIFEKRKYTFPSSVDIDNIFLSIVLFPLMVPYVCVFFNYRKLFT